MDTIEFDGVILKSDGGGAFVRFPCDVMETFGTKGQVKVACEFDGVPYRGSIVNMGTGPVIGILKTIRGQLGKQAGDTVHVKLWKDEQPREVDIPERLKETLRANPKAGEAFELLSYSHKREYAVWVGEAKKQETQDARVQKTVEMLLRGVKSPKAEN
jgi:hypothetical protein